MSAAEGYWERPAAARGGTLGTAYALPLPGTAQRQLAGAWMALGVVALGLGGVFAILLVLARTPGTGGWLPAADFFRVALVAHVDLTVLIWFSTMAAALWSLAGDGRGAAWSWVAFGLCIAGTLVIAASALWHPGPALMSNYIPVLDDTRFVFGLVVFGAGIAIHLVRSLLTARLARAAPASARALRRVVQGSAVAAMVALLMFAWSAVAVPTTLNAQAYYELLFWGGGHVLQFAWTLLAVVAWLWLATACGVRVHVAPRLLTWLLVPTVVAVLVTPYAAATHGVLSAEYHALQTQAMRWGGGLAAIPVLVMAAWALAWQRGPLLAEQRPLRGALICSLLLFAAGGVIAWMISGSNVRIPAHYHGSIVGVTLALMGLVYHLLPRYGWQAPQGWLARTQPWIYGGGQLLHVLGLAWSGGYGVQRKVAGAEQALHSTAEVTGMALMGLGGLLAIIGGGLFVVVVWLARPRHRVASESRLRPGACAVE